MRDGCFERCLPFSQLIQWLGQPFPWMNIHCQLWSKLYLRLLSRWSTDDETKLYISQRCNGPCGRNWSVKSWNRCGTNITRLIHKNGSLIPIQKDVNDFHKILKHWSQMRDCDRRNVVFSSRAVWAMTIYTLFVFGMSIIYQSFEPVIKLLLTLRKSAQRNIMIRKLKL